MVVKKTTELAIKILEEDEHGMILIQDEKSFTGYRWKSLNEDYDSNSNKEFGIPASVFEVELWKSQLRLASVVKNLRKRVYELEEQNGQISVR